MFKLLAISSVFNLLINLLTNLKSLVGLAIIGTICFFGYLLYQNGMDFGLAIDSVKAFWLSVWGWMVRAWEWGVSVMPF